jgi:hypothetical protein
LNKLLKCIDGLKVVLINADLQGFEPCRTAMNHTSVVFLRLFITFRHSPKGKNEPGEEDMPFVL